MKFKYDFLNNRLWKLTDEYSYQITEENHFHTDQGTYGTNGFHLGEKEWIIFALTTQNLQVHYQNANHTYQKVLPLTNTIQITFEFTSHDLLNENP